MRSLVYRKPVYQGQEMATASATVSNVLLSTPEKENYLRIARLLIVGGNELMRNIFDKFHPPSSLPIKLTDPATKRKLMATLMKPQRDCVYPSAGVCGESKDFDISLLSRLLKTICPSLPPVPTATGWDRLPNSTDLSVTADIVRIKVRRNDICHKYPNMEISDDQFSSLWNEIKEALVRIADFIDTATRKKWEKEIDELLKDPLTPEAEKNARELWQLHLKDMDVKECTERGLKNLQTELKVSSEGIVRVGQQIKGVQESLQGELQNVKEEIAQKMEEGVECLERVHERTERIDEGVGRLEREIQGVQGSVSQVKNEFKQLRELIIRRPGSSSAEPGGLLTSIPYKTY